MPARSLSLTSMTSASYGLRILDLREGKVELARAVFQSSVSSRHPVDNVVCFVEICIRNCPPAFLNEFLIPGSDIFA